MAEIDPLLTPPPRRSIEIAAVHKGQRLSVASWVLRPVMAGSRGFRKRGAEGGAQE
jgi:hypothetical protein